MSAHAVGRPAAIRTKSSNVESRRTGPSGIESPSSSVLVPIPAEYEITVLAYSLWEQPSRPEGSPKVDWFNAKRQLC